MGIIEIKCYNCGKTVYMYEEFIKEKMFCTLGCMDAFNKHLSKNDLSGG